jgi:predicted ArsR family transcriptional regulator
VPPPSITGPTTRHRALAHPSRVQVLELLRGTPDGLDVNELARRSGLHPNTVRVHLVKLTAAELVEGVPVRHGGRGRPSIRYRATDPPDEDRYRLLSSMLATALSTGDHDRPSPAAEAAGRRWGQRLADAPATDVAVEPPTTAADAVTALFDQLGFAPARDGDRIALHACPYRDLATRHPDVICGLHLGLLRGALDEHGERGQDAWLVPLVTPTECVAGLASADTDAHTDAHTDADTEERP